MNPQRLFSGIARLQNLQEEHEGTAALMDALRPRFTALANRHQEGTAPRAITAFNLFQTPPELAAKMADLAELSDGLTILEPSAGLGRLIIAAEQRATLQITAVESSQDCARELFNNHADLKLYTRDFLTLTPEETGLFDRVIMNPPFKMRRDIKHIEHARSFLKPNGLLVALCLATDHRRNAFEQIAEHFQTIPANTFRSEGTGVETFLLTIRNQTDRPQALK